MPRDTSIGAVDSSTPVDATSINDASGACLDYEEITSNSAGTTNIELISTLATVPVNSGRLIRIEANGCLQATGPTNLQVLIQEDGIDLCRRNFSVGSSGRFAIFHVVVFSHSPSAGNHQYKLHSGIAGGSGETATFTASATTPALFWVSDFGPDF